MAELFRKLHDEVHAKAKACIQAARISQTCSSAVMLRAVTGIEGAAMAPVQQTSSEH